MSEVGHSKLVYVLGLQLTYRLVALCHLRVRRTSCRLRKNAQLPFQVLHELMDSLRPCGSFLYVRMYFLA